MRQGVTVSLHIYRTHVIVSCLCAKHIKKCIISNIILLGSGGSFRHAPGEGYHNSSRQLYPSGTHVPVGQRAPFPDQRFGPGQIICMCVMSCIF